MVDPQGDPGGTAAPNDLGTTLHSPGGVSAWLVASYVCGAIAVVAHCLESKTFQSYKLLPRIARLFRTNYQSAAEVTWYILLAAVAVGTLACAWCLGKGRTTERLIVAPPTIVMLWWLLRAFGVIDP